MESNAGHVRIGRYHLEDLLGRGGMAEVYRATDVELGRTVAIKKILPALASQPKFLERFLREARVVAALEHPNILPVYDFGEHDGTPYLVMPYVEGGSLARRAASERLPRDVVARWIGQLAEALDTAHSAGILHRDVKPANVLMAQNDRPILADFGLARLDDTTSELTATGVLLGTPLYMAPEFAAGASASPATDLYALAVLAYEMLAGRPPFLGENAVAILHQHVSRPVPPVSGTPGLSPRVDEVFARALAKDPAERPTSCDEFASELQSCLSGSASESRHGDDSKTASLHMFAPKSVAPWPEPRRRVRWGNVATLVMAAVGIAIGARFLVPAMMARVSDRPGSVSPATIADDPQGLTAESLLERVFQQVRRPSRFGAADFEKLGAAVDRLIQDGSETAGLLALREYASGGSAYADGNDRDARQALDRARSQARLAPRPEGYPTWMTRDARPAAELPDWELALIYRDARGVARDLLKSACAAGDASACRRVEALRSGSWPQRRRRRETGPGVNR